MKNYKIFDGYQSRLKNEYFDDTALQDQYQKEVYEFARKIADNYNFKNILDIGTGSGYKLIKYFNDFNTLGIDVTKTVDFLKKTYPNKEWSDQFVAVHNYDIIVSSDVIEHIPDPDELLLLIKQCNPKMIVLSTPDRSLVYKDSNHNGPPTNGSHVREWSYNEFSEYIKENFNIIDHFISHKKQATQVMLCKPYE